MFFILIVGCLFITPFCVLVNLRANTETTLHMASMVAGTRPAKSTGITHKDVICMKETFLLIFCVSLEGNSLLNHQSDCKHYSEEFGCTVPPTRQDRGCGDPGGLCHEIPQAGQLCNHTKHCLNPV